MLFYVCLAMVVTSPKLFMGATTFLFSNNQTRDNASVHSVKSSQQATKHRTRHPIRTTTKNDQTQHPVWSRRWDDPFILDKNCWSNQSRPYSTNLYTIRQIHHPFNLLWLHYSQAPPILATPCRSQRAGAGRPVASRSSCPCQSGTKKSLFKTSFSPRDGCFLAELFQISFQKWCQMSWQPRKIRSRNYQIPTPLDFSK